MVRTIIFDQTRLRPLEGLCPYAAAENPARLRTTGLVTQFETAGSLRRGAVPGPRIRHQVRGNAIRV